MYIYIYICILGTGVKSTQSVPLLFGICPGIIFNIHNLHTVNQCPMNLSSCLFRLDDNFFLEYWFKPGSRRPRARSHWTRAEQPPELVRRCVLNRCGTALCYVHSYVSGFSGMRCAIVNWYDWSNSQWVWLPLCLRFHGGVVSFRDMQLMGLVPI